MLRSSRPKFKKLRFHVIANRQRRGVGQFAGGGKPWELFASQRGGGESQPPHGPSVSAAALHGRLYSVAQSGSHAEFGRNSHKRKRGGNLVVVLLHAPDEGPAVFRADQRLRRTHALGYVSYQAGVCRSHGGGADGALLDTEAMNALDRIVSERLQFPAIRTGTFEFYTQNASPMAAAGETSLKRSRNSAPLSYRCRRLNRRARLLAAYTDPLESQERPSLRD